MIIPFNQHQQYPVHNMQQNVNAFHLFHSKHRNIYQYNQQVIHNHITEFG